LPFLDKGCLFFLVYLYQKKPARPKFATEVIRNIGEFI